MNNATIQSSFNKVLLYSTKAIYSTAHGVKTIAGIAPGILADIIGPQIGGAGYDWVARPLVVGIHSLSSQKTNRANALFNAFSLPVGRAIIAIPQINQSIDAVTNVISKVSDFVTDKIPEIIISKQAVQTLKQYTKAQFVGYLQALVVHKLASSFFKVNRPEPSIASVITPMNVILVAFTCSLMRLITYLQSEGSELATTEPLPSPSPQLTKVATKASETDALNSPPPPAIKSSKEKLKAHSKIPQQLGAT